MSIPSLNINVLTDRLLGSWIRCKRKAWLDLNGSKDKKVWSTHRTLQLDQQHKSFSLFIDETAGVGLKGCQQGASYVYGIRLKGSHLGQQLIEARPLILQKIKGHSSFGDFSYRPVIAKQGKRTTREHRLSLALWGRLLENLQNAPVKEVIVIAARGKEIEIEPVVLNKKLNIELNHCL